MKRIATPPEEDRATVTCNMHTNLVKFGRAVFVRVTAEDRQTDILIAIFRTFPGAK